MAMPFLMQCSHTFRGVNGVEEPLALRCHGDEVHERVGCIGIPAIACQSLLRKLVDVLHMLQLLVQLALHLPGYTECDNFKLR